MAKNYKMLWKEGNRDHLNLFIGFFICFLASLSLIYFGYNSAINYIVVGVSALGACIIGNLYLYSCPEVQEDCEEGI